jgi:hypothetical protein
MTHNTKFSLLLIVSFIVSLCLALKLTISPPRSITAPSENTGYGYCLAKQANKQNVTKDEWLIPYYIYPDYNLAGDAQLCIPGSPTVTYVAVPGELYVLSGLLLVICGHQVLHRKINKNR